MLVAPVVDAVSVLLFVALGRRSHDERGGITTTFEISAPFLIALALGWFALRAWRRPTDPKVGASLAVVTVAIGQVLRRVVFDRGTALAFVIVSLLTTGLFFIGWRLAYGALRPRFARPSTD